MFLPKICRMNGTEPGEESLSSGTIKYIPDFSYSDCENLLDSVRLHFPSHWRKSHSVSLSSAEHDLIVSRWQNFYLLRIHCWDCFHYSLLHGFSCSAQLCHHYFWTSLPEFQRLKLDIFSPSEVLFVLLVRFTDTVYSYIELYRVI